MNAYNNRGAATSTAPLPTGMWASAGGAYTQTPQANQYTSTNLNDLIASGSPYIQQARQNAAAQANASGIIGSSYAAGNAQRAAISAALPIATQDAGVNANAALANQQALNTTLNANNQNATSRANAATAAGASMYGSDRSYEASRYGQDQQTLRQGQQNDWQGTQNSNAQQYGQSILGLQNYYQNQQAQNATYNNILQGAYSTVFSNPDNYNNPQAAMGFVQGFGNYAANQLGQYYNGGS